MTEKFRWIRLAAAIALSLAFCVLWSHQITDSAIVKDAGQNLTMALNLRHNSVMSLAEHAPYSPSMHREPIPVFSTALSVALIDRVLGPTDTQAYFAGERSRYVKYQNVLWMALLCIGTFWAIHLFTSSVYLGVLGIILVNVKLPLVGSGLRSLRIDTLYSDLPAAAMLVLGCAALVSGLRRARKSMITLAGLCFGILALIKASFLYVFAVAAAILLCLYAWRRRLPGNSVNSAHVGILVAAFAAVVLPWMYRNYATFGSFQISERGGHILDIRAVKDEMTAEEVRGSFYVWAPNRLQPLVGRVLGFSPRDLQRGGRLQRLNRSRKSDFWHDDIEAELAGAPERAISFYRRARAERVQLCRQMGVCGGLDSDIAVDTVLKQKAFARIRERPLRHFAMTIPFLWRGGLVTFPLFVVTLAYAVRARRYDIGVFVLPAFGLVMFFAVLSHFIPRYGVPVVPVAVVSGLILSKALWDALMKMGREIIENYNPKGS
jgi:hypothetical protein